MRLIGLLSWYEERPSWLAACIGSYAEAGITHLVAIDGAYALYPNGHPRSTVPEHETIIETTSALGVHLTLVLPNTTWDGNEIEKRNALFAHAEAISEPGVDWYVVIDADELVTTAHHDWTTQLAATQLDAADMLMWDRDIRDTPEQAQVDRTFSNPNTSRFAIRKAFRAIPGLRCHNNHYTYRTPDGRNLWGQHTTRITPALDLTDHVHIEHRSIYRSIHRREQAQDYYRRRDKTGIETPSAR